MVHIKCPDTVPVPKVHINCADFVERSVFALPGTDDKVAYLDSFTGTSITYAQLFELGARFGRGLPSTFPDLFPSPDPRVVTIFSPNALLYPVVTLGVLKANDVLPSESGPVIVSTTNAALTSYECAQQWEASTASLLIVHPSLLDKAVEAWNLQLGRPLERIVLLDESGVLDSKPCLVSSVHKTVYQILATGEQLSANNHSRSASAEPLTPVCPSPPPDSNEDSNEPPHVPAFILFSSGTTSGKSKPIVISHYNVVGVLISMTAAETRKNAAGEQAIYPGEDVVLGTVPTFHAFGMFNVLWHAMYLRVKVIMFSRFDADKVIEAFDTHSINYGFVVPPMLIAISARTPPAGQHPSLRWLMSAAAPLLEEVITKARAYFGRNAVRNGMGMTELVATAIATAPGEPLSEGRAGVLNPNNEALIIDPKTGMEAGYNYPGELYIRGPQVVREFWGGGKDGEMLDISGFLHSGDIATVSEDGTFFIRDRLKEMIKVNGISVAPADIESVVLQHPSVADCAVASIPHHSAGEAPVAYVVLQPSAQDQEDKVRQEIKAWCKERMARYKQPDGGIFFIKEVPKSASGKVLRRLLKVQS